MAIEQLDFRRIKNKIGPTFLPILDFLESVKVTNTLMDENASFYFEDRLQHWRVMMRKDFQSFTVLFNKMYDKITVECDTMKKPYHKFKKYDLTNNSFSLDEKYGDIKRIGVIEKSFMYCAIEFNNVPTDEQVALLYQDLFLGGE